MQELEAFASSDALVDILKVRGQAGALANSSAGWQALKRVLGVTDVSSFPLYSFLSVLVS